MQLVDPHKDSLFTYNPAEQKAVNDAKPWKTDPHHFKNVRISGMRATLLSTDLSLTTEQL